MNNIIKCPICHEMAGLRYNENRVYQSRCQNMKCRETVTVTAPSGKAAEELFSKFEKGMSHPKLSIPKKIAELVNTGDTEYIRWSFADDFIPSNDFVGTGDDWRDHENLEAEIVRRKALVSAYLAGKALGVELVEVEED